jgi:hypothetical protein
LKYKNIIKEFSDPYFYNKVHELDVKIRITSTNPKNDGTWIWGLDENGNLCFKWDQYQNDWFQYFALEAGFIPKPDF